MEYETVIGLEIYVALPTRSKLFCGCSTAGGAEPNTNCCPVCLGLPGALPRLNRRAVEFAVMAALALCGTVQQECRFDRKTCFSPRLPIGYRIVQCDHPLALGGSLELDFPDGSRRIKPERVCLEEEAGRLVRGGDGASVLVDYNRAGIPLLKIVTKPELRSGREACLFLEKLHAVLLEAGIAAVKPEQGVLRCDAGISLRPAGSQETGTRTEVRNLHSFCAVEETLNAEAKRQAEILRQGGRLVMAACHWDGKRKVTVPLPAGEDSSGCRYFPEPDLLPLRLERFFIEAMRRRLTV